MAHKNTRRGFTQIIVGKNTLFASPLEGEDVRRTEEGAWNKSFMAPPLPAFGHPLPQGARITIRAFTLIELLVVVLIIGILAAVAVPQYQTAVDKSRVMPYIKLAWEIKRAEEVFYLANGYYTHNLRDLDVDYRQGCKTLPQALYVNLIPCSNHIFIDIHSKADSEGVYRAHGALTVAYCPNTDNWDSSTSTCKNESILQYTIAFDHGGKSYISSCSKKNNSARGERLCKIIQ